MSDVVIVGGGIVGLASAYELARAGAKVTLLEYGKTGMQATNAAAGILAPLIEPTDDGPMLQMGLRALNEYPALIEELQATVGFEVEYRPNGILNVAFDRNRMDQLRRAFSWQRRLSLPLELLDAQMCRELEPRLSERVVGGIFSSFEGSVSSQLLALALERAAVAHGADVRNGTPATGFDAPGERVCAVRSHDECFSCDTVVLAAGARSGQVARIMGLAMPVRPVRGQMIALGGMRPPIAHIIWGRDGYLVPRANGMIFAGATIEDVGFRRRTTKAGVKAMTSMAGRLVPQLAAATMQFAWAGLRPATSDGLPIIGPLPEMESVVAATGHYRSGILLGPLTGSLVGRGIRNGDWSGVPPEFSPARFASKTP